VAPGTGGREEEEGACCCCWWGKPANSKCACATASSKPEASRPTDAVGKPDTSSTTRCAAIWLCVMFLLLSSSSQAAETSII
jgi:hypothetical protein